MSVAKCRQTVIPLHILLQATQEWVPPPANLQSRFVKSVKSNSFDVFFSMVVFPGCTVAKLEFLRFGMCLLWIHVNS